MNFFPFFFSNDIDVALINETYLKQGTRFSHPAFRCYRLDREGARTKRGVAILVRQNVPHSLLSSFQTKVMECIGISVNSPTGEYRIPLNRIQSPSILDIVLSNGLHELDYLSTRTELSSDHLPVLFEVTSDSRREVPNHYIFNYKRADWNQFKILLDLHSDCISD
jgi:hypothetical protein